MPRYDTVLFDLDGTLTDSGPGIMKSVAYALEKFGIAETDSTKLRLFVGPALVDSFTERYGFSRADADEAVRLYRERYIPVGIYENEVYPGIPEMLKRLKDAGLTLCVATAKPELMAERVLEHFGLLEYFTHVVGATEDEKRTHKKEVLEEVLIRLASGGTEPVPDRIVMIGDRCYDIEGARSVGLDGIGVRFGYASPGELEAAGAVWVADSASDLADYLLQ